MRGEIKMGKFIVIEGTDCSGKGTQSEMLYQCVQTLCKALFNKNAANAFWSLFESIYNTIIAHPQYDVQQIYLSIDSSVKSASPDFDILSLKYFIAVVKEGVQDEN